MEGFDPVKWLAQGRELVRRARAGEVEDVTLSCDVSDWPDPWVAAELLTHDLGTEREIDADIVIFASNPLVVEPEGDALELLDRAEGTTGAARVAALEAAWRACFAPELADAIEAADAAIEVVPLKAPKKKADLEKAWAAAAVTAPPRGAFAGPWPSKWKDAQRRMRVLYQRPRSPLLAAAAVAFAQSDALPYTSQASQTFWQALAWFIAEQGDVRQLAALDAIEGRIGQFLHRIERHATDALRAFEPPPPPAALAARLAKLGVVKPAKATALSLASPEERLVAADQLQQAGDPRGEFIAVQMRITGGDAADELVLRQAKLLKKHAKEWCPPSVDRNTCVFRGGVPVAGHLRFLTDSELRLHAGTKALATFETLIVDTSFAMGDIENETIVAFFQLTSGVRTAITTDLAANLLARSEPAPHLEHVVLPGRVVVTFDGGGLPNLRRVDAERVPARWPTTTWFARLAEFGCADPAAWHQLWCDGDHQPAIVLAEHAYLHARAPSVETPWELVAHHKEITARPLPGSTAASLAATLAKVPSWDGVTVLRVPDNFAAGVRVEGVPVEGIAPVDPACLGISLALL